MKPGLNKLCIGLAMAGLAGLAFADTASPAPSISNKDNRHSAQVQAATLRSALETPTLANNPSWRFAIRSKPAPTGWIMLLGALFTGGFIARRRLARD